MSDAIIVGLISAGVTLLVCLLNNSAQQKKADVEQDKLLAEYKATNEQSLLETRTSITADIQQLSADVSTQIAVIDCKVATLSEEVKKHNSVIERTYKLETDVSVIKEKQSVANHRIDDLERRKS